ncbi:RING 1A [Perilla frutescens var. hirtella]|nr:RING 1A [Perilla frutescens var. hirtella]KAH6808349.1 RING 1A [Perilla frutescens var. frutescens]
MEEDEEMKVVLREAFSDSSSDSDGEPSTGPRRRVRICDSSDEITRPLSIFGDSHIWEQITEINGLWICRDFLSADQQSSLLSALRKDGYLAEASHNQVVEDRVQLLQELEELDITEKSAASLGKPEQSRNAYIASAESALTNPCTLATFLCFSSSDWIWKSSFSLVLMLTLCSNNECPACRTHCTSRRSLRDDPNYDALIVALYPDIDKYEEEQELAFHEEERDQNKQIQASIAQTLRRQSEALGKKRTSTRTIFILILNKVHHRSRFRC